MDGAFKLARATIHYDYDYDVVFEQWGNRLIPLQFDTFRSGISLEI